MKVFHFPVLSLQPWRRRQHACLKWWHRPMKPHSTKTQDNTNNTLTAMRKPDLNHLFIYFYTLILESSETTGCLRAHCNGQINSGYKNSVLILIFLS
jgi:hypothetical protein